MTFHDRHWEDITLSEGKHVATAKDVGTCFSDRPIKPGETLELQVLDDQHDDLVPTLYIGITKTEPKYWNLKDRPNFKIGTACMSTLTGLLFINGENAGQCGDWVRKGCDRDLRTGDKLKLSLTLDKTVSISLNDTQIHNVFPSLFPDRDLWLVVEQAVKQIKLTKLGMPDVAEKLQVTAELNQLTLSESPKPKATKLSSTIGFPAYTPCSYWKLCLLFVQRLGIPDEYFDPKYHMCFCQSCMDSRKDKPYYDRGVPPKKYALPVGWTRFGLSTPPRAVTLEVFKLWHTAFHGTSSGTIKKIMDTGDLLLPGDHTLDGNQLNPPAGHFTEKRKPAGFDIKQVFVSPSIRYAGLPVYARPERWEDNSSNGIYEARVALQLRIKPDSYKVGPETVLPAGHKDQKIDPGFSNSELEWSTKHRGAIILTGLMVHLMPK